MSATKELRRMLDERGVEWEAPNSCLRDEMTMWTAGGFDYEAFEVPEPDGTFLLTAAHQDDLTTEQAIEATLGRGTCRFIDDSDGEFPPKCSACGYEPSIYECSWLCDGGYEYEGNYCSNCGARVVEVDE